MQQFRHVKPDETRDACQVGTTIRSFRQPNEFTLADELKEKLPRGTRRMPRTDRQVGRNILQTTTACVIGYSENDHTSWPPQYSAEFLTQRQLNARALVFVASVNRQGTPRFNNRIASDLRKGGCLLQHVVKDSERVV